MSKSYKMENITCKFVFISCSSRSYVFCIEYKTYVYGYKMIDLLIDLAFTKRVLL